MSYTFLLQEIFPTQGSNTGILHCRQILYHLCYQGSPKEVVYIDRYTCTHIHTMEYYSAIKKNEIVLYEQHDGPGGHYA